MLRKLVAAVSIAVLSAFAAGSAFAAPGGLGPPGPDTPSGEAISRLYWIVLGLCAVVFVLVETALILFIVRFRRRRDTPESAEGPQIHGNTRLEIIWTAIPAIILAGLAIFTFTQIPAVQAQGVADEAHLTIRVEAHQFYWEYRYPGGEVTVDTLYLPVDEPVELRLTGMDVIHSWWVPALAGKMDAIPGKVNTTWFETPLKPGKFEGQCAEYCGIQHALMPAVVRSVPEADFDEWVSSQLGQSADLGKQTYEGACGPCHGLTGNGLIGPSLKGNATISQRPQLIRLLRNGKNAMPPVGRGWNQTQLDALIRYLRQHIVGAAGGG